MQIQGEGRPHGPPFCFRSTPVRATKTSIITVKESLQSTDEWLRVRQEQSVRLRGRLGVAARTACSPVERDYRIRAATR